MARFITFKGLKGSVLTAYLTGKGDLKESLLSVFMTEEELIKEHLRKEFKRVKNSGFRFGNPKNGVSEYRFDSETRVWEVVFNSSHTDHCEDGRRRDYEYTNTDARIATEEDIIKIESHLKNRRDSIMNVNPKKFWEKNFKEAYAHEVEFTILYEGNVFKSVYQYINEVDFLKEYSSADDSVYLRCKELLELYKDKIGRYPYGERETFGRKSVGFLSNRASEISSLSYEKGRKEEVLENMSTLSEIELSEMKELNLRLSERGFTQLDLSKVETGVKYTLEASFEYEFEEDQYLERLEKDLGVEIPDDSWDEDAKAYIVKWEHGSLSLGFKTPYGIKGTLVLDEPKGQFARGRMRATRV